MDAVSMDNQQARLTERDLAWLAGMWEADGSFGLNKCDQGNGYIQYQVNMQYVNTDTELVIEVISILRKMHVGYYQLARIQPVTTFGTKLKHEIRVQGMKRGYTFLSQIVPYLRGAKKRKAELILEFIKERLSKGKTVKYGPKELAIFDKYLLEASTTNTSNALRGAKIESELAMRIAERAS